VTAGCLRHAFHPRSIHSFIFLYFLPIKDCVCRHRCDLLGTTNLQDRRVEVVMNRLGPRGQTKPTPGLDRCNWGGYFTALDATLAQRWAQITSHELRVRRCVGPRPLTINWAIGVRRTLWGNKELPIRLRPTPLVSCRRQTWWMAEKCWSVSRPFVSPRAVHSML